jgi:hypothetical protein
VLLISAWDFAFPFAFPFSPENPEDLSIVVAQEFACTISVRFLLF